MSVLELTVETGDPVYLQSAGAIATHFMLAILAMFGGAAVIAAEVLGFVALIEGIILAVLGRTG